MMVVMQVAFYPHMNPFTPASPLKFAVSTSACCEMFSIQLYVTKFGSDVRMIGDLSIGILLNVSLNTHPR